MTTTLTQKFGITPAHVIMQIFAFLLLALLIVGVIRLFTRKKSENSVLRDIQILRRSIGAAFLLGLGLTVYASSQNSTEWKFAGPVLLFISMIHYGYARRAEKNALVLTANK